MSDGIFNISDYKFTSLERLDNNLILVFYKRNSEVAKFKILLENTVHHTDLNRILNPVVLRIDDGETTYGWDFAIRMSRPEIRDFDVLYLFEDIERTSVMFKALAEKITIIGQLTPLW